MQVKAHQKFIRISPRKVRLVADSIRGLPLRAAQEQLKALNKGAALPLRKTLRQAIANAVNNHNLKEASLSIKEIQIGEGSTYKRWNPVSRGRAHPILKRTSSIRVILQSNESKSTLPSAPQKTTKDKPSVKKPKSIKTTIKESSK